MSASILSIYDLSADWECSKADWNCVVGDIHSVPCTGSAQEEREPRKRLDSIARRSNRGNRKVTGIETCPRLKWEFRVTALDKGDSSI